MENKAELRAFIMSSIAFCMAEKKGKRNNILFPKRHIVTETVCTLADVINGYVRTYFRLIFCIAGDFDGTIADTSQYSFILILCEGCESPGFGIGRKADVISVFQSKLLSSSAKFREVSAEVGIQSVIDGAWETFHSGSQAALADFGTLPGLPDLMGFGRRSMAISNEEAKAYTLYQISAIGGMCKAAGVKLQHVKPHGALYNMAAKDYDLSKAICEAIYEYDKDLIVMGLSGSEMIKAAKDCGLKAASEVFADRAYEEDGTLVNRRKPGAMIEDEDEAIKRVIRMIKEGKVTSITGKDIDIKADSVCVHGDGEKALLFVEKIRKTFVENEIEICHL